MGKPDIKFFINTTPRPIGEAMHATKPNEITHFDYLYISRSKSGMDYLRVIKDDASKYVWLIPSKSADSEKTVDGLMNWFAAFGICYT